MMDRLIVLPQSAQLFTPESSGINGAKATKGKSGKENCHQRLPQSTVQRATFKHSIRRRLSSAPKPGPGFQP